MANVAKMSKPYGAVVKEDWEAMESYFMKHKDAVYCSLTVNKDTAIHIAVYSGNFELLKKLLDVEATVKFELHELTDDYGNTPLHVAAAEGDVCMARLLIDKDKDAQLLKTKNSRGETPLFTAAAFGCTKMVKEFLVRNVQDWTNHRRRNDSVSILHVAVIGKNFGRLCLSFISS